MANAALEQTNGDNVANFGEMLPVDPFRSLYVHFGMLLGVEDFRTLDAYHRGKMWFHTGWLHRQGVIWGLKVSIDRDSNEIRVAPGMAVDEMGRELYLMQPACLNLNSWYEEHKEDAEMLEIVETDEDTGEVKFDAHVLIKFKACLNRQVPALTEPCDGSNATTAYSRVVETVELIMLPGKAPVWRDEPGQLPFHRLRLLFGLEQPLTDDDDVALDADQAVIDVRSDILDMASADQPAAYLKWLRHFAALDEIEMSPAEVNQGASFSMFPGADPAPIPLADLLQLRLLADTSGWLVDGGAADNTIRPVHIPTSTIQELVCGPMMAAVEGDSGDAPAPSAPDDDAGGPRIDPESVRIIGEFIQFDIDSGPLMKASVDARGLSVTAFDTRDGWVTADIKKVKYTAPTGQVEVELRDAPGGNLVRLIVKGTGAYPFLGRNRIPLAGSTETPEIPGSKIDGNDFVTMLRVRS
ncbi:MAG: hypothetical protein GY784_11215 [Gammaproteobacteria bacterium]|nr:hypothetical protein [Gammaproteobacteria bacterium]